VVIGSRGRGIGRLGERGLNSLGEGGSGGPRRTRWLGGGGPDGVSREGGGGGPRRTLWLGVGGADGIGGEKAALWFRGSCELLLNSFAGVVPPSALYKLEPSVGAGSR
jgi:hypothetical protein